MPQVLTERVLVVPTQLFRDLGYFQGFCGETARYLDGLFDPEQMSFRPRSEVEEDPSYKQLIPYVLLKHGDTLFQYTRGKGQGEGRLHAKRSVGIGGHISAEDARGAVHPYDEGMRRELDEEVAVETKYRERCVGLINDDQTEVGKVHLGVVHLFELDEPRVRPREDDLAEAGFQPIQQILANLDRFETWSQIVVRALFA
jgi:predicted NUDIX family phosphoesterase